MHGITYAQLWKSIVFHARKSLAFHRQDGLAEWSKALASGASPQGRGFEPHSRHMNTCMKKHAQPISPDHRCSD
jgi:hypothetical protein